MDDRDKGEQTTQATRLVARGRQAAQGLVEYGLVIGVVGVLAIAALTRFATNIGQLLDRLGTLIQPIGGG